MIYDNSTTYHNISLWLDHQTTKNEEKLSHTRKERLFNVLKDSKHSICTARCEIFDIFAHSGNAKMLVGDNPQTPYFLSIK